MQLVKGGSSKWLDEKFGSLRKFAWQEGYGAFSVGASQVDEVAEYIAHQEEYLSFPKEYKVEYGERYIWG